MCMHPPTLLHSMSPALVNHSNVCIQYRRICILCIQAIQFLAAAAEKLRSTDYAVQTLRIITNPFCEWLNVSDARVSFDTDHNGCRTCTTRKRLFCAWFLQHSLISCFCAWVLVLQPLCVSALMTWTPTLAHLGRPWGHQKTSSRYRATGSTQSAGWVAN